MRSKIRDEMASYGPLSALACFANKYGKSMFFCTKNALIQTLNDAFLGPILSSFLAQFWALKTA